MFYVISLQYNRPADGTDRIEIRTEPARGNLDREPVLEGWAGTTNDVATWGQGKYASEQLARVFILERYGALEEIDHPFGDPDVIATFQQQTDTVAVAVERTDWRLAVAHDETLLGYSEWVDHQLEATQ